MSQTGVALVTGGAKRIGRAIALDLATHGWSVAVHFHHSADDAASVVTEISEAGGKAAALGADLAEPRDTEDLIKGATAALGPRHHIGQ